MIVRRRILLDTNGNTLKHKSYMAIVAMILTVCTITPSRLNAENRTECIDVQDGQRAPGRVSATMLIGLEPQFIQLVDDATTILQIRDDLDASGNPEPTAAQEMANTKALNRFSVNLEALLRNWDDKLAAIPSDWESRDNLAQYARDLDQLFGCISHFSSYRFQNTPKTRAALDSIKGVWKASILSANEKLKGFYARHKANLVSRIKEARSGPELKGLQNEIGQILSAKVIQDRFYSGETYYFDTPFKTELLAVFRKRRQAIEQEGKNRLHASIDIDSEKKKARASLLLGNVRGWMAAAKDGVYFSNSERTAPLIQSQLSCEELYGIPAIRFRAIVDPESNLKWRRSSLDRGTVPITINGVAHRGLQEHTRTSNTVNSFHIWFVDDDFGRRMLDTHLRKYGARGAKHPAETKLYAPVGGYGSRKIGNPFYLFDTYIPLRSVISQPSLSISGKLSGGNTKAAEGFVDIGGSGGPLETVFKACFGALAPEFLLGRPN